MNGNVNHPRDPGSLLSTPTPAPNQAQSHVPSPAEQPETVDTTMDEEIRPDHYFDGGKIPVFKPRMDQFRDFSEFVRKVDKYGMKSGIIKVIPPKEWSDSLPRLDEAVKSIRCKNPIMQEFHGSHGTYTQANIERQRSYNLPQWKSLCSESNHQPPARRGERRRDNPRVTRASSSLKDRKSSASTKSERAVSATKAQVEPPTCKVRDAATPNPASPGSNASASKMEELHKSETPAPPGEHKHQPKIISPKKRKSSKAGTTEHSSDAAEDEAFRDFNYRLEGVEEYTPQRCKELEVLYWKSLMYSNPLYGADMPGSLFDESTTSWNVAALPNLLDVLGENVLGVNTAYLYLGMWKASFAWHLEDVDLYSINYIHFGAPKQWYSISQEDLPRFEAAMRSIWSADAKNCDQFLRHKTYLISPSLLKSQFNIEVNRLVHYEGEFVITYPYGYHSGFNLGYNCAESVNFATEKWLDYARVAKKCNCVSDSVWINVDEIERKLRGEPTPELTPSVATGDADEDSDAMSEMSAPVPHVSENNRSGSLTKKRKLDSQRLTIKRPRPLTDIPEKHTPCTLCPNDFDYEELLPAEDGATLVHRKCALYIDETDITIDSSGREVVTHLDKVPKARMGLKCLYCRDVYGACFQCMYGKCTKAYHATCALLAGVQIEHGFNLVVAEDGREYSVPAVDLKCRFHRPKRTVSITPAEALASDYDLLDVANGTRPGDLVQFQVDKTICAGMVLENRHMEKTLLLRNLQRCDVIEIPYCFLLMVRRSSFLPLPPGIQPLPSHLARRPQTEEQIASIPLHGTPFTDFNSIHRWDEFITPRPFINPSSRPVDLSKPDQMWYYLGDLSTETRAQYTDDPAKPFHNPKSNFLSSVNPSNSALAYASHVRGSGLAPAPPSTPFPHYASAAGSGAIPAAGHQGAHVTNHHPSSYSQGYPATSYNVPKRSMVGHGPNLHVSTSVNPTVASTVNTASSAPLQTAPFFPDESHAKSRNVTSPTSNKLAISSASNVPRRHQINTDNKIANIAPPPLSAPVTSSTPPWAEDDPAKKLSTARCLVSSITEHANQRAGYTIVQPEVVVKCLIDANPSSLMLASASSSSRRSSVSPSSSSSLSHSSTTPQSGGMQTLKNVMATSLVPRKVNDNYHGGDDLEHLDMSSSEVNDLLQMLQFAINNFALSRGSGALSTTPNSTTGSLRGRRSISMSLSKKQQHHLVSDAERNRKSDSKPPSDVFKLPYFESQRQRTSSLYKSPYAPRNRFSDHAKKSFGLVEHEPHQHRRSLAVNFFQSCSIEDKKKIISACGKDVTMPRRHTVSGPVVRPVAQEENPIMRQPWHKTPPPGPRLSHPQMEPLPHLRSSSPSINIPPSTYPGGATGLDKMLIDEPNLSIFDIPFNQTTTAPTAVSPIPSSFSRDMPDTTRTSLFEGQSGVSSPFWQDNPMAMSWEEIPEQADASTPPCDNSGITATDDDALLFPSHVQRNGEHPSGMETQEKGATSPLNSTYIAGFGFDTCSGDMCATAGLSP